MFLLMVTLAAFGNCTVILWVAVRLGVAPGLTTVAVTVNVVLPGTPVVVRMPVAGPMLALVWPLTVQLILFAPAAAVGEETAVNVCEPPNASVLGGLPVMSKLVAVRAITVTVAVLSTLR
jgi:hypothetical protein